MELNSFQQLQQLPEAVRVDIHVWYTNGSTILAD